MRTISPGCTSHEHDQQRDSLPSPLDCKQWIQWVRSDPRRSDRLVSRCWMRYRRWHQTQCENAAWERQLAHLDPTPPPPKQVQLYVCYDCDNFTSTTERAWRAHRTRVHPTTTDARFYVNASKDDGTCGACGNNYRTRKRLLVHLRQPGVRCLTDLRDDRIPLPCEAVQRGIGEDKEDTKALKQQGMGPAKALTPARLHQWRRSWLEQDERPLPPTYVQAEIAVTIPEVPIPNFNLFNYHVVLNLTGRPRTDSDIQHYMEELCRTCEPTSNIWVITMNCADNPLGDLTDRETAATWLRRMHNGEIIGLICEPPQDTWIPREQMIRMDEEGCGTPPGRQYRTASEPWG